MTRPSDQELVKLLREIQESNRYRSDGERERCKRAGEYADALEQAAPMLSFEERVERAAKVLENEPWMRLVGGMDLATIRQCAETVLRAAGNVDQDTTIRGAVDNVDWGAIGTLAPHASRVLTRECMPGVRLARETIVRVVLRGAGVSE